MIEIRRRKKVFVRTAILLALSLAGSAYGQAPGQKTYATSKEALAGLIAAVKAGDTSDLMAILGPGSESITNSGDAVADKNSREAFLTSYEAGHSLVPAGDGDLTLQIGKDGWPAPIPLAHAGDKWYWDGAAGKAEVLYRRIGHNELAAINACKGIVAAQRDYAATSHDGQPAGTFAQRIVSEPGKQNGLYWVAKQGEAESPAGPLLAAAASEGYDTSGKRVPYHGYYYHLLPVDKGFALVAYPADYRSSGVMTFLVNEKGVIREKDLGEKTTDIAQQMKSYSPDATWRPAK